MQKIESKQISSDLKTIYYFSNLYLFNRAEAQLVCNYKHFIENVIMKLGEDWRIQSSLFAQEIIALRSTAQSPKDMNDFNLFNQFLSAFLQNKIGKEFQYTNFTETQIEQNFLEKVNKIFHQEKINGSLTFKTLSLGYCITANELWNRTFRNPSECTDKTINIFRSLGKLVCKNLDIQNGQNGEQSIVNISKDNIASQIINEQAKIQENNKNPIQFEWSHFQQGVFSQRQINRIKQLMIKLPRNLKKSQIFGHFLCYVDDVRFPNGKHVRVCSLANQFYFNVFIIWLIFSIKMFFSLSFTDYLRYCKQLMNRFWTEEEMTFQAKFERPLKIFQVILQSQWNKLLKDYRVALNDDLQVLHMLIDRICKQMQREWQLKINSIKEALPLSI